MKDVNGMEQLAQMEVDIWHIMHKRRGHGKYVVTTTAGSVILE
jgi:hypothetical protein